MPQTPVDTTQAEAVRGVSSSIANVTLPDSAALVEYLTACEDVETSTGPGLQDGDDNLRSIVDMAADAGDDFGSAKTSTVNLTSLYSSV